LLRSIGFWFMDSSHLHPETADQIDKARRAYFDRNPDRPESRSLRGRTRQPVEIVKAKTRMRTAAWRCDLDRRRRPESGAVALAFMLAALRVANVDELDPVVHPAFEAMLGDMMQRGYDPVEVMAVVRRLHHADRTCRTSGQNSES
jgi:hypothetical protein